MLTITRKMVWAIAADEADRHMRKEGRRKWNEADYEVAVQKFNIFWSIKRDAEISSEDFYDRQRRA